MEQVKWEFSEEELNLSDFALFLSVMKNQKAHENVLSIIMDETDLRLRKIHVEEVVLNRQGHRAIRLDAWAEDEKNRQFSTEMQNDTSSDDVRRRARFYQGLLDTPLLKSGKKTRYRQLPSTVVTFITQEDIFERDLARYTFSEQCEEIPELRLGDGTRKIFLNMESLNGRAELVSLLQYMKKTSLDNPAIQVMDPRIVELDEIVQEVKESEEWEEVRMSILSIGLERGMEQGMAKSILALLEEFGTPSRELRDIICSQKDQEILEKWLKTAAKAGSMDEAAFSHCVPPFTVL